MYIGLFSLAGGGSLVLLLSGLITGFGYGDLLFDWLAFGWIVGGCGSLGWPLGWFGCCDWRFVVGYLVVL